MKFVNEFRKSEHGKKLLEKIARRSTKPARLMEFCGGHTVAIFKYGIRQLLPPHIEMLSGPGCPVCVTATSDLDRIISLSQTPGVIITSFGDLLRVPSSHSSLQAARAEGGDIRIVYSTLDALDIARQNPDKKVVFIGIGFETTAPTIAASIVQAHREGLKNYYVMSLHKITPPVTKAILDSGETRLDGIVCPGHVTAVIGSDAWQFLPKDYGIACAVSGFEPLDILYCVSMLVEQIESGQPKIETAYPRAVRPEGNPEALRILDDVFEVSPANWRGIGVIPGSGLTIRKNYADFDAEKNFCIEVTEEAHEPKGCLCGEVLRGVKTPLDCKLFKKVCNPESPVGPCMVSSEGTCAAYYHYGDSSG
jgi:hydrogenase expression/formation protein HypD